VTAKRNQELDLYPLHTLRGLAQHEMGALRRSGTSLVLTRTGRLMSEDPAVRWHIGTAALIGPDDGPEPDFTVAVREAALLIVTLHDGPVGYEELASRLTDLHAAEGWTSLSGSSLAGAIRGEIHVLRHRLRALQLLDEDASAGPLALALTSTGTAAALSALLARALRPRRHSELCAVALRGEADGLEARVVLREGRGLRPRGRHVSELRQLQLGLEGVLARVDVQHGGHPPGEVGGPPHPPQAGVGIGAGLLPVPVAQRRGQGGGQQRHVRQRQVQALGPGGRHDVRRVAGQEQAPVTHRRGHEAAHRRDRLVGDRALPDRPA
jgi:hypothetical protein